MKIPKPTQADKDHFTSLLPERQDVELKPMFGNLGAFVHGNMFAGLFGQAIGVRLAETDRAELSEVNGSAPFGPAERPMSGYLSLPPAWRDSPEVAAEWVGRALAFVAEMPAKKAKPKKASAKTAGRG